MPPRRWGPGSLWGLWVWAGLVSFASVRRVARVAGGCLAHVETKTNK